MRKLLLTILFIIIIAMMAWWLVFEFRKSTLVTKVPLPETSQPLVTEPPPDSTETLLQDNLDEALQDIQDFEK